MTIRPRMDQKPRPLHYFVPGQVVLHVTRSAGASDAEIIEQVGKQVSDAQRGVEVPGEFVPLKCQASLYRASARRVSVLSLSPSLGMGHAALPS